MQHIIVTRRIATPVGDLILGSYADKLCLCDWVERPNRERIDRRLCRCLCTTMVEGDSAVMRQAEAELAEYFAGEREDFSVPLLPVGTSFQMQVWLALRIILYGTTMTYAEEARLLGCPSAVRAVAAANAANAISIFIPCHRVVGARGLTGYAGGLEAKRRLLELEAGGSVPAVDVLN